MRKAYLISNIEEYGKFISYCIERDICVFRTFWSEKEKGDRCYSIDWTEKRCYYASRSFFLEKDIPIVRPLFTLDQFGNYRVSPRLSSEFLDEK